MADTGHDQTASQFRILGLRTGAPVVSAQTQTKWNFSWRTCGIPFFACAGVSYATKTDVESSPIKNCVSFYRVTFLLVFFVILKSDRIVSPKIDNSTFHPNILCHNLLDFCPAGFLTEPQTRFGECCEGKVPQAKTAPQTKTEPRRSEGVYTGCPSKMCSITKILG